MIRILQITDPRKIKQVMQQIGVDPYGIKIMLPKAHTYLIKVSSISNIAANILKQEMLSLGGEVCVARGALTGKLKKTDCLIIGNYSQLERLIRKLDCQPFGLDKLSVHLSEAIHSYNRRMIGLELGRYKLDLNRRIYLMGIVNLTPDSFSGNGLYSRFDYRSPNTIHKIVDYVEKMIHDGADIIDIGAESSRPGAKPISEKEELARIMPVIKALVKRIRVPISVDTYKPTVARQVLDNGVSLINDITGLRDPMMARVVSRYKAGVVIMHMKGVPSTMQKNPHYFSLMAEIIEFLNGAVKLAEASGIGQQRIVVDPGIGFGKTLEHNLTILNNLGELKILGKPIMVGTSRKSFIGSILGVDPQERLFGTVASCVLAAKNGANILRVHDIKEVKQALKVTESIINA